MRRQVGIGEGTRAAAGARRRAESGGRADTAGRGGQVGKRGGRLREVGQHPRPMQAAGALSSGVWTGPTVDSGLCCGARVGGRRADEESTRDWQRACVPGGQCDGETLLAVVADPGDVGGGGRKAAAGGVADVVLRRGGGGGRIAARRKRGAACCCNGLQAQGARGSGRMSRRRGESLSARPCRCRMVEVEYERGAVRVVNRRRSDEGEGDEAEADGTTEEDGRLFGSGSSSMKKRGTQKSEIRPARGGVQANTAVPARVCGCGCGYRLTTWTGGKWKSRQHSGYEVSRLSASIRVWCLVFGLLSSSCRQREVEDEGGMQDGTRES